MKCPHCDAELPPGVTECDCLRTLTRVYDLPDERTSACDPAPLRPGWPDGEPVPPPPEDRYEIERELRRGAYGIVWLAWRRAPSPGEPELQVAIRRLIATDAEVGQSFQRYFGEAEQVQRLDHRSIIPVLEFDQDEYGPFVVTEYVEGSNLADEIEERGPFGQVETARIGMELCRALHYAHTRPEVVCHGELKPSRVLITEPDGSPRLMDFRLSRRDPEEMDPWDDVLALGTVLYEMVTKRDPEAGIVMEEIPSELRFVIRKATAVAPKDRYATMQEFRLALARCVERSLAPTGDPTDQCPSCGRHPVGDHRYCPKTGDELYRACPSCGGENTLVGVVHCTDCGCAMDDVEEALDALRRGEECIGEKNYSRALEEFERAVDLVRNHAPAQKVYVEACASRDQASALLAQRGKTREKLDALIEEAQFGEAMHLLRTAKGKDPSFTAWAQYEESIPHAEAEHLLEEARRFGREHDLDAAAESARRAVTIDSPVRGAAEKLLAHTERLRLELRELEASVAHHLEAGRYAEVAELCESATVELSGHPRVASWRKQSSSRLTGFAELIRKGQEALDAEDFETAERRFREAEKISPGDDGRGLKGIRAAQEGAYHGHLDRAEEASRARLWKEAAEEVELAKEVFPRGDRHAGVEKSIRKRRSGRRRRRILVVVAIVVLVGGWFSLDKLALWRVSQGDVGSAALIRDWFGPVMLSRTQVEEAIADYWVAEGEKVRPKNPRRCLECFARAATYRSDESIARKRSGLRLELAAKGAPEDARTAVQDARAARTIAEEAGLAELSQEAADLQAEYEDRRRVELVAAFAPAGGLAPVSAAPACELRFTATDPHLVAAILTDGEQAIPLRRAGTEFSGEYVFEEESTRELTVRVQDDLDVEATLPDPVRVTYDATKPVVTAPGATDGVVLTDLRNFELRFEVTDDSVTEGGRPLASVRGRVDDGADTDAEDLGDAAWSLMVRIPSDREEVTVTVEATDAADLTGVGRFTVRLRTGASSTNLLAPEGLHHVPGREVYCTKQAKVTVRGTTGLPIAAAWCVVRRDGQEAEKIGLPADQWSGKTIQFPVELAPGDNVIQLFVKDQLENTDPSEPLTLCLDLGAPRVGEIEPVAGDGELKLADGDGVPLLLIAAPRPHRLEAEDASPPVRWFVGDHPLESPEIQLTAGDHDLKIRAVDALGHESDPIRLVFRCRVLPSSVTVRDGALYHSDTKLTYVPAGDVQATAGGKKLPVPAFLMATRKVTTEGGFSFEAAGQRAAEEGLAIPTETEWLRASLLGPARPSDMAEGEPEWVEKTTDPTLAALRDKKYPDGWRATCGGRFWSENAVPTPWAKGSAPPPIAVRFVLRFD